jgi:LysR family transcriptional regulator, benzoate and cis,cis-muconate-responsive activator of ben and cat genes
LRYFQAVAEELSYSRAARRLRIAQPALSRAVKEMEATLEVTLLERNRRTVRLTPAGRVLLHEAAGLFDRWEESLRRVRRAGQGEEGELKLGYIGPPAQPFLGRLLAEYRRRYPLVSIHLEERTPERVWEMVARGRLSAGLTRPVPVADGAGLQSVVLRQEKLGVALPASHALAAKKSLTWRELRREPLIVLARREGVSLHDAMLAGCRAAGFAPRLVHTPSLIGTVLDYVRAGAGLGVVTDSVLPAESGLDFRPLRPAVTVPFVLVWQQVEEARPVQRFRELLAEWLKAGLLWPK